MPRHGMAERWLRCVPAAVCLLLVQCAFINTFYNARSAFVVAERYHRKQMRQYPDSLVEPAGEALGNYDRAIAKCQKVLEVYRKNKRWHDDAIFLMGRAYYNKGEMSSAIRQFRHLQEEFPQSRYIPESYYYLAQAYVQEERYQKAEEVLALILEKYPELNRDERIWQLQAKLALRREGKAQAVELLKEVLRSVTSAQRRIELTVRIAGLLKDLKQCDAALVLLRKCPRERKLPSLMYQVDYLTLGCLLDMDSLAAAGMLAEQMLRERGYQAYDAKILLRKAEILVGQERRDDAVRVYERVTVQHEGTAEAGQAWYELATIYHRLTGDLEKARECYLKASVTAKDTALAAVAARRASALSRLDTLRARQAEPADSGDSVRTPAQWALAVGEVFWLDLDQPDSAYARFRVILADTSTADTLEARALFSMGYLALHALGDTAAADSVFEVLLERFPATNYSKRAQIERGRRVTVRTRSDSAEIAFRGAEKLYVERGEAVQAVEAYLRVYAKYPECDVGPRSLYAAAWLSDNVTSSKDLALFLYRKVCEKYPHSAQCEQAAKPRLRAAADSVLVARERALESSQRPHREKNTSGTATVR